MNVLVTGANGQLGMSLRDCSKDSGHNFIFTDVNSPEGMETVHLDITDAAAVELVAMSERVDVIVNCAAYTNVEKAEDDAQTADLLNRQAPAILASVAKKCGATLVHISTDYVFPGDACRPVKESDATAPVSVYGKTKLSGEKEVINSGCNYIILRTAWLYSPYGKNFCKTMMNVTANHPLAKVVCDQVGTPTYAADLAAAIMHIICTGQLSKKGIYHFSDEGAISWYDFAQAISSLAGNVCDIHPIMSDEFPSRAARPHYSVLDKSLFKTTFDYRIPYWMDSLRDCISKLK